MAASPDSPIAFAQLCKTCRQLEDLDAILNWQEDDLSEGLWTYHDQWPGLPHLEASANSGCDFCRLLRETLLSAPEKRSWPNESHAGACIQIRRATHDDSDHRPLRLYGFEASLLGFKLDFDGDLREVEVRKVFFQTWTKEQKVNFQPASMDAAYCDPPEPLMF